jgi:hypothetical protein
LSTPSIERLLLRPRIPPKLNPLSVDALRTAVSAMANTDPVIDRSLEVLAEGFSRIGVPVFIALALSSLLYTHFIAGIPDFVILHRMAGGLDSFPLLAVPFFILAGNLMNSAGITNRIYDFAVATCGWITAHREANGRGYSGGPRLAVASRALSIFSRTISSASRRAHLPPRISFIIRSAITPFASAANIIKEVNIRPSVRRGLKTGTLYISERLSVLL